MLECFLHDIIKMRYRIALKTLYILLCKWEMIYVKSYIYDILKMIYVIRLNVVYRLLLKL
jgi:hypothetical protein